MGFGERLKSIRIKNGLKQRELADKLKTTNTSVSNWEKELSRPSAAIVELLAKALNVSVFDLLGDFTFEYIQELNERYQNSQSRLDFEEGMALSFAESLLRNVGADLSDDYFPFERAGSNSMREVEREIRAQTSGIDSLDWEKLAVDGGMEALEIYSKLNDDGKALVLEMLLGLYKASSFRKVSELTHQPIKGVDGQTLADAERIRKQLKRE